MQYCAIPNGSGDSIGAVDIVHNEYTLRWNMVTYTRFKLSDPAVIFREVNAFWAGQSTKIQDRAFLIYWFMYRILRDPNNVMTMSENSQLENIPQNKDLTDLMNRYIKEETSLPPGTEEMDHGNLLQREYISLYLKKLYDMFTIKDSDNIVANMSIVYATTMSEVQPVTNKQYPDSGRTHTRVDYNALASLAIRMRPVLPVFGQCMHVYQDKRRSGLKESAIVKQLELTDIFEMSACNKLKDFMEASLKTFKQGSVTTVNGGIGTAELVYWCLAKALYRRVACGEIDSTDGQSSIVTNIFNFIEKSVLESVNRNFGPVHRKTRPDEKPGSSKGEDNQSIIESIKAREEITRGRRRMVNVFARNVRLIAKRIDPSIPIELVDECCKLTSEKLQRHPHMVQDGLVRWVLSAAAPRWGHLEGSLGLHHNVDYLRREELALYMGVAQAVLEHWGYIELAALFDATVSVKEGVVPVAAMWSHDDFSPEVVGKLVELFPYEISGTRRNPSIEERNVGARDVREMTTAISIENWIVNKGRYTDRISVDRDGYLVFPAGFVNKIAELLIYCCSPNIAVGHTASR